MNEFASRVRRIVLGPTDKEVSAMSQAAGGPPYPIPPLSVTPPTATTARARFLETAGGRLANVDGDESAWVLTTPISAPPRPDPASEAVRARQTAADHIAAARTGHGPAVADMPSYVLRDLTPAEIAADLPYLAAVANETPPPVTPRNVGRPIPIPNLDNDPTTHPDNMGDPVTDTPRAHTEPGDEAEVAQPRHTSDPLTDPLGDSGVHTAPTAPTPTTRTYCAYCEGTGYVERPTNDLLRESLALIPANATDDVIREFYTRLISAAPHLAPLFPRDLLSAATGEPNSRGALQRDRLFGALEALAKLYGAGDAAMGELNAALASMGRAHAAFARPDGTVGGATVAEYLVVKEVFFGVLVDFAGTAWHPGYTAAWSEAYDYAMVLMLHAQFTSGMTVARYPRRSGDN